MTFTSIILRLELDHRMAALGDAIDVITASGGDITSMDMVRPGRDKSVCDITIHVTDTAETAVLDAVKLYPGLRLIHVSDRTFLMHLGGKISIQPTVPIKNRDDLSRVYTPGVARICTAIRNNPDSAYTLTIKRNTVAIITDGTSVLGLGDIGPSAALPVMEGKAMLFKQMAGVDAFPICLDTKDPNEIVDIVKKISPVFGGINLEDIGAPRCFEIERRLAEELDIPVLHDDQHGTSIVVAAGLLNALKVVGKRLEDIRVVVNGIGAAGGSICRMLLSMGVRRLVPVDRDGAIVHGGRYANPMWQWLAEQPQVERKSGTLREVLAGADVFIGVSRGGVLHADDIRQMSPDPVVFALANPVPEVEPAEARPLARVLATGRSDYPNQINNALVFPGIFRGALDCRARRINDRMKLAAAQAIAGVVSDHELNRDYIIPGVFNERVVPRLRRAVIEAAIETGEARRIPPDFRNGSTG
ncbi:MAG: NAD-dependent malic enzyme [Thermobacillus sp.]|uniref:NAD-dependent malic enzyme n=1 Tax=Thermobacillus sp. TaxID=2108467 RepID=UPI000E3AE4CC|nr:NAD-dependent malic enzyme [Thermobacillus sp.]REK55982.1 MAG: NAD-dependent malic enzyme [Thermobacillus sp.]